MHRLFKCDIPKIQGWDIYDSPDQYPVGTKVEALHFGQWSDKMQTVTPAVFDKWGLLLMVDRPRHPVSTVTHIRVIDHIPDAKKMVQDHIGASNEMVPPNVHPSPAP